MNSRRNLRPISAVIAGVLERAAPQTLLATLQTAWPRAAGAAIGAESSPVSERDGVVTIGCDSASWAEQLDLLQDDLLARFREELGAAAEVRELRFLVVDRDS